MLFILTCTDQQNATELRAATRPAHLEYLRQNIARLKVGGPFLKNGKPAGSLIVLEAESEDDAAAFAAADPYALAGLFESVTVTPYRLVFFDGVQVNG